jgi:hypothetical protein
MNSRIHPLDEPRLARRIGTLGTLCLGMMIGLVVITAGIWMVIWFALDGQPLTGHLFVVGGLPLITLITGVLTLFVPPIALWAGWAKSAAGLRELPPDADAEQLLDVFAGVVFTEYAVAGGVAFAWALVFHATSDPLMLLWIAALLAFMTTRYPTIARTRVWFNQATEQRRAS